MASLRANIALAALIAAIGGDVTAQGLFRQRAEDRRPTSQTRPLFPQVDVTPLDQAPEDDVGDVAPQSEAPQGDTPDAPDAPETAPPADDAGSATIPSAASAGPDGVIAEVADPVTTDPEAAADPGVPTATRPPEDRPEATPEVPQDIVTPVPTVPKVRPQPRPDTLARTGPEATAAPMGVICGAAINDPDIRRNADVLRANPTLCIDQETVTEHGRNWSLITITDIARRRGPRWAVLHDDEDAAFDAGIYALSRYGGAMVAIDAGEARGLRGQDPNRNFGLTPQITAACGAMQTKPAPNFTRAFNRMFLRRPLVLSLHSNHDGHAEDGGQGDLSAARSTDTRRGFLSTSPKPGLSDPDNAILIAGLKPYESTPAAQDLVAYMSPLGINVIYEQVTPDTNDCSLSAHAVLNKMGDYYNIEVEHGRLDDQKVMLDALMGYLGIDRSE